MHLLHRANIPATTQHSRTNLKLMAVPILDKLLFLTTLFASAPYYKIFHRGTYRPVKRILESQTDDDARTGLQHWCRYKIGEAGYVQVAVSTSILFLVTPPPFSPEDQKY